MQRKPGSLRNKLMVAVALVAAAALASPGAMARGYYHGHGGGSGDVLGALIAGAVIGGVLVSASQHDRYYGSGYYAAPPYPTAGYYGGYPAAAYPGSYAYPTYPAYAYSSAYYGYPDYASGPVSVGVVYSNGGTYGYRGGRYYDRGYRGDTYQRGPQRHYGNRGWDAGNRVRANPGYRGRGGQGHYYSHRGH